MVVGRVELRENVDWVRFCRRECGDFGVVDDVVRADFERDAGFLAVLSII